VRLWMGTCPELERKIASKGKAMNHEKSQHHMMFGTLVLVVLFAGLTLFVASIVRANPVPDSAGQRCDVSFEVRNVPRSGWGRFHGRKEHERSRPSLAGSSKAAGCGTRSDHLERQGRDALFQGFTQRGTDSLAGFLRSLTASKEIACTLETAVVATGNGFS